MKNLGNSTISLFSPIFWPDGPLVYPLFLGGTLIEGFLYLLNLVVLKYLVPWSNLQLMSYPLRDLFLRPSYGMALNPITRGEGGTKCLD